MVIKKLQNNFTTPEQSKRLSELGVPADSADCFIDLVAGTIFHCQDKTYSEIINNYGELGLKRDEFSPCWSIGRLIEIMLDSQIDTGTYALGFMLDKDTFSIESIIDIIDEDTKEFDFSKLEE